MRMLANVPRIITSWLPRRVPYWLKSSGLTWWASRYFPAGESALIDPAGEMWSVVIESRNRPRIRASTMSVRGAAAHAGEIRRVLHVGGVGIPPVGDAAADRDPTPVGIALEHVGILAGEHALVDDLADHAGDLAARGPDVLEI